MAHNRFRRLMWFVVFLTALGWFIYGLLLPVFGEEINVERLADAIYHAEGGANTAHPYGILAHYKHTTPRQACLNTIKSARKRFAKQTKETDFIHFLGLTYCPIGAKNDPTGLNKNWERNVKRFYYGRIQ